MSEPGNKAVFLSYASQDAEAAKRICDALRAAGVEVWFDQSELVGGDQWDGKIRGQISSCALFVPIISANTQARLEGYFRLEWKLAAQRTHTMADEKAFLLPVLIDDTRDAEAKVPAEFKSVQWTKLPGGDTPPAFAQRVMKLLSGSEMEAGRPRPAERGEGTAPPKKTGKRWLVPAVLGAVAIAVATVWLTRKPAPASATDSKTATAQPGAASLTEAQKLVAQARKIYGDGDELNRDNLFLADEIVQRALALDPSEPSAWELATWFSYIMAWHAIDVTQARRETLLRQANRAIALAPDSVAAQLVYANAQLAGRFGGVNASPGNFAPIEAGLKQLAGREPQNWKIQRALGTVYRLTERIDEAVRAFNRAIELSDGDPMATADLVNVLIRRNRFAEAEALLARGLAHHRSSRLLTFNLIVKYRWRGDVESAAGDIADWPEWLLQQDRGFAVAWQAAIWARQPDLALRLVLQFPRQEVRDIIFSGPKAVLSARAQELAGNIVAAQADWRAVLQQCDQELAANASDLTALYWKAWALARLGDQTGAQAAATLLRQRLLSVPSNYIHSYTAAALWATVGWTDVAVTTLQAELEKPSDYISLSRAGLELEPAFDPIRRDPRFVALLAQAPAPKPKTQDSGRSSPPAVDSKSIAVLPFANLSDDKENAAFFADGMHEDILTTLANIPELRVVSRTSVMEYRGTTKKIPQIGRELNVAYVLEGSVRRAGNQIRLTGQLIRAATDEHLWAKNYDRELTTKDMFAIQAALATEIANALQAAISPAAHRLLGRRPTENLVAYDLYLKARSLDESHHGEAKIREKLLQEAVGLDANFAAAWGELAANHAGFVYFNWDHTPERLAQAEVAIARAVRLAPDAPEVITMLGRYSLLGFRDYPRAAAQFEKVIQLQPNNSEGYINLGYVRRRQGRWLEALGSFRKAEELDRGTSRSVVDILLAGRRWAEAIAEQERILVSSNTPAEQLDLAQISFAATGSTKEVDALAAQLTAAQRHSPQFIPLQKARAVMRGDLAEWIRLDALPVDDDLEAATSSRALQAAMVLAANGDLDGARTRLEDQPDQLRSTLALQPANALLWAKLALMEALLGENDSALRNARKAVDLMPTSRDAAEGPRYRLNLARVYAWTGDKNKSVAELAQVLRGPLSIFDPGSLVSVHTLRVDPTFAPLRGDPRFEVLLSDPQNSAPLF